MVENVMKSILIIFMVFFGVLSTPSHAARIEAKVDISQQKLVKVR
jgi:hypothetical protein